MKTVTTPEIEQHLRDGFRALAPEPGRDLLETQVEQARGDEWYLDGVEKTARRSWRALGSLAAAAACLVLLFTGIAALLPHTAATVYLDVNPSISLALDRNDRVLEVRADNADGALALAGMDLKHTQVEVAVNALIGSMVRQGFLSQTKNVVLLSVDGEDRDRVEALRQRLSGEIDQCLDALTGSGTVLDQTVHTDKGLEAMSRSFGITPGKAALIRQILETHGDLDVEELAAVPLADLQVYLERNGVDLRDYTNCSDWGALEEALEDYLDDWEDRKEPDAPDDPDDPDDLDDPDGFDEPDEPEDTDDEDDHDGHDDDREAPEDAEDAEDRTF